MTFEDRAYFFCSQVSKPALVIFLCCSMILYIRRAWFFCQRLDYSNYWHPEQYRFIFSGSGNTARDQDICITAILYHCHGMAQVIKQLYVLFSFLISSRYISLNTIQKSQKRKITTCLSVYYRIDLCIDIHLYICIHISM